MSDLYIATDHASHSITNPVSGLYHVAAKLYTTGVINWITYTIYIFANPHDFLET